MKGFPCGLSGMLTTAPTGVVGARALNVSASPSGPTDDDGPGQVWYEHGTWGVICNFLDRQVWMILGVSFSVISCVLLYEGLWPVDEALLVGGEDQRTLRQWGWCRRGRWRRGQLEASLVDST